MKENKPIIVDTNILISSLLNSNSPFSEFLLTSALDFFICELAIVELFKNKERIASMSKLTDEEVTKAFYTMLRRLNLFKEDLIQKANWQTAHELCRDIDETDTPFVALTLELDGLLLTGDKKLKDGLTDKGFQSFFNFSSRR